MPNHYIKLSGKKIQAWPERDIIAARVLNETDETEVFDFGCGLALVRKLLRNKRYTGFDSHRFVPESVLCDLNVKLPKIDRGFYNERVALCTGILEYLVDVDAFFKFLEEYFPVVVFSYYFRTTENAISIVPEARLYWIPEIIGIVMNHYRKIEIMEKNQFIWMFKVSNRKNP